TRNARSVIIPVIPVQRLIFLPLRRLTQHPPSEIASRIVPVARWVILVLDAPADLLSGGPSRRFPGTPRDRSAREARLAVDPQGGPPDGPARLRSGAVGSASRGERERDGPPRRGVPLFPSHRELHFGAPVPAGGPGLRRGERSRRRAQEGVHRSQTDRSRSPRARYLRPQDLRRDGPVFRTPDDARHRHRVPLPPGPRTGRERLGGGG